MTDLIARLEAATEGGDELDALVDAAADNRSVRYTEQYILAKSRDLPHDECIVARRAGDRWQAYRPGVKRYTTSIDAALTLVPEGFEWEVKSATHRRGARVNLWSFETSTVSGDGATSALAFCIAALKARETE